MTTTDPVALERFLAELDWSVHATTRQELSATESVVTSAAHTTLTYVRTGEAALTVTPRDQDFPASCAGGLAAGDLLLSTARTAVTVRAVEATHLVTSELDPAPGATRAVAALPGFIVLRAFDQHEPAIAQLTASMGVTCEQVNPLDGLGTVCGRIATAIVAVAMRSWSDRGCAPDDWLLRAQDPHLRRALDAIHADPGRAWTVADLATLAAMSRTVFAERFRLSLGRSPAAYLTDVRMARAERYLGRERLTVIETSRLLGYESEAGFSRAFTRHTGSTPSAWRRQRLAAAGA